MAFVRAQRCSHVSSFSQLPGSNGLLHLGFNSDPSVHHSAAPGCLIGRKRVLRLVLLTAALLMGPVVLPVGWLGTVAASAQGAVPTIPEVNYQPPVSGPVVDGWRPPPGPYGAGNRGVDYATHPGEVAGSPANGVVSFAGSVAGVRWVVVRHGDGRRSSIGPLAVVFVPVGASVRAGQQLGTAAGVAIHWGVREADVYVDPTTLLPPPVSAKGRLRLTG